MWISSGHDVTYGCFNDSTYGFFIYTTCGFFINKCYIRKGVTRAGKGQESGFLPLLALPLMMKAMGNRFIRARREYNTMNHMAKKF